MAEDDDGPDEELLRPAPRPHKPIGLTPMKAKRGKPQEPSPPARK